MTKKDYIKFAAMIKARVDELHSEVKQVNQLTDYSNLRGKLSEVQHFAGEMANIFADDNDRFDSDRFLKACGVKNVEM